MRLLINDVIQYSNAPKTLKSPMLADIWSGTSIVLTLDSERVIDCIGIGNTDATSLIINGQTVTLATSDKNGLYMINEISTDTLTISHNGTYAGRIAAGKSVFIGISPPREPGFWSTNKERVTLMGQVVPGIGGVSGRKIDVDIRYKINQEIYDNFKDAYQSQVGRTYPMFIYFDLETHRLPITRFYGYTDSDMTFQSSVNYMLYSKRFSFREAF